MGKKKTKSKMPVIDRGFVTTSVRKTVVVEEESDKKEVKRDEPKEQQPQFKNQVKGKDKNYQPTKVFSSTERITNDSSLPTVNNLQTNQLKSSRRLQNLANKKINRVKAHIERIFENSSYHQLPYLSLESQNPKLNKELIDWAQNKTFLVSVDDGFDSDDEVSFSYPHLPFSEPYVRQPQKPVSSADSAERTLATLYEASTYSELLGFPEEAIRSGIAFLGTRCTIPALLDYMLLHPEEQETIPPAFRDFALINELGKPNSLKESSCSNIAVETKENPRQLKDVPKVAEPVPKEKITTNYHKEPEPQKTDSQSLSLSDVSLSSSSDEEYMFDSEVSLEYAKLLQDKEIFTQLIKTINTTPLQTYLPKLRRSLKRALRRLDKMKTAFYFNQKEAQFHLHQLHPSRPEREYSIKCGLSPTFDLELKKARENIVALKSKPKPVIPTPSDKKHLSESSEDEAPICLEDLFSEETTMEAPAKIPTKVDEPIAHMSLALIPSWTGKTPKQLLQGLGKSNKADIKISSHGCEAKAIVTLNITSSSPCSITFTSTQNIDVSDENMEKNTYRPQNKVEAENLVSTIVLFKLNWLSTHSVLAPPFQTLYCDWRDRNQMDQDLSLNQALLSRYDFLSNTLISPELKEKDDIELSTSLNPDAPAFVSQRKPAKPYWERPGNDLKRMFRSRQNTSSYRSMLRSRELLPISGYRDELLGLFYPNRKRRNRSDPYSFVKESSFNSLDSPSITELGHSIVLVVGETGCGKTTQVPQFLVEDSIAEGRSCKIVCTQPRRISAVSVAQRVAQELGEPPSSMGKLGSLVGYQVRLGSRSSASNLLIFCTLGVLLRRLENDPNFKDLTHLVIDEIQERSLDSDFLLVLVRRLLQSQTHLKVVLMSATIDADTFSNYFSQCPVLHVPGRTFPVETFYLEDIIRKTNYVLDPDSRYARQEMTSSTAIKFSGSSGKSNRSHISYEADLNSVFSKSNGSPRNSLQNMREDIINYDLILHLLHYLVTTSDAPTGAIIVFLPGIPEIKMLHSQLETDPTLGDSKKALILQAHSGISPDQQSGIFSPCAVRKIVLATNVAETGITIPDATIVIDSGRMKQIRFDKKIKVSHLEEVDVAQANAKQRAGRAGRVQPGLCFRLFTKVRYDNMIPYQSPEMERLPLEELCLRIKAMGHQDVSAFLAQTIHPPPPEAVTNSLTLLHDVGALASDSSLTPLGIHLSRLPVSVFIGKVMIFGALFRCLDPALTIAALLSYKSPFIKPEHGKEKIEGLSAFASNHCDFLSMYKAYCSWRDKMNNGGMKAATLFCSNHSMSLPVLLEIENMKQQYLTLLISSGFATYSHDGPSNFKQHPEICNIPRTYDTHAHNDSVIKCILVGGLYPKVLTFDSRSTSLHRPPSFGIPENLGFASRLMRIAPSPVPGLLVKPSQSSIHYKLFQGTVTHSQLPPSNYRHAVFFSLMKGKNNLSCEALSFVPSLPLLLFAKDLVNIHPKMCVADNLRFRCSSRISAAIMQLRLEFNRLLEVLVAHPFSHRDGDNDFGETLLKILINLLSAEL